MFTSSTTSTTFPRTLLRRRTWRESGGEAFGATCKLAHRKTSRDPKRIEKHRKTGRHLHQVAKGASFIFLLRGKKGLVSSRHVFLHHIHPSPQQSFRSPIALHMAHGWSFYLVGPSPFVSNSLPPLSPPIRREDVYGRTLPFGPTGRGGT